MIKRKNKKTNTYNKNNFAFSFTIIETENRTFDPLMIFKESVGIYVHNGIMIPWRWYDTQQDRDAETIRCAKLIKEIQAGNYHVYNTHRILSYPKMREQPRVRRELIEQHIMQKAFVIIDRSNALPYLPDDVKGVICSFVVA